MHDHHLKILQDFREEILQQRPALAAEMEAQLKNMSQTIQATMQGEGLSLDTPYLERGRSEDLRYGSFEGSLPSDTHSRRSQSLGAFTVAEFILKPRKEKTCRLQRASCLFREDQAAF